ncbi:hypothetical protein COU37_05340 [Candidatus Micrarchaeota archaeon CG10_big_fil_rev_8_21_14_0_10_45_29]|nr:MAG: hypothetical protein COU37_05340 [Candidatus Micrarchaeota archaeon CG10_big_fil_rev_8_21_14_0_10_45_29]
MASIVSLVESIKSTLLSLGPNVSVILIVLGGLTYGLAQTQPAHTRGKWQSLAIGIIIGGIIVAAVTGAAEMIALSSTTLLT